MITIPLSKTGKHAGKYEALVSVEDDDLAKYNWHCHLDGNTAYVRRWTSGTMATRKQLFLHRVILERILGRPIQKGKIPDHLDGDGLNNTRDNLREVTQSQNMMNRRKNKLISSGYKGVYINGKKWRAALFINKKQKHIGTFDTPEQAHAAYCVAAKKHFGEFANEG